MGKINNYAKRKLEKGATILGNDQNGTTVLFYTDDIKDSVDEKPNSYSYDSKSDFPSTGLHGAYYLDINGRTVYTWDSETSEYVKIIGTQGTTQPPLDINDLGDVSTSGELKNQVLKFDGTKWVNAASDYSFIFSISSFTSSIGLNNTTFEMGLANGVYAASQSKSFSLSFLNGSPSTTTIGLSTGGSFVVSGSTGVNGVDIIYPSSPGSVTITASATVGGEVATKSLVYNFYNNIKWGVLSKSTGITQSDILGLGGELSQTKNRTVSLTGGSGEYYIYAYPKRLGVSSFKVGGFDGGFNSAQEVSVTNASGYTEIYYIYSSVNSNLGSSSVQVF